MQHSKMPLHFTMLHETIAIVDYGHLCKC